MSSRSAIRPCRRWARPSCSTGWWATSRFAGLMVVMTSNSTKHRSGANALLAHVRNRILMFSLGVDLDGWRTNYAEPQGMHFLWPAFTEFSPGSFATEVPPPDGGFCTLRSFTGLHSVLVGKKPTDRTCQLNLDDFALDTAIAAVGEAEAIKAFAFFKTHAELPDFAEIEQSPGTAKCPGPDRMDVVYSVMGILDQKVNGRTLTRCLTWNDPARVPRAMVRKFPTAPGRSHAEQPGDPQVPHGPEEQGAILSGVAGINADERHARTRPKMGPCCARSSGAARSSTRREKSRLRADHPHQDRPRHAHAGEMGFVIQIVLHPTRCNSYERTSPEQRSEHGGAVPPPPAQRRCHRTSSRAARGWSKHCSG